MKELKKMNLKKLHNPEDGQMRIAGLMSGRGSNLIKIIEFEKQLGLERNISPYHVAVIFSDTFDCNAKRIGESYNLPVITGDIRFFYSVRGKPRKDLNVRNDFDSETVKVLSPYDVTVAVYAGYMSIATQPLINAFLGINVHPADLSVMKNGKRRYVGDHAVRDAIIAGEQFIRSTTHIVEEKVDYGRILMISQPLEVILDHDLNPSNKDLLDRTIDENQQRLKATGDWIIFPKTLLYIAEGRYSQDNNKSLYFDGNPIPNGLKL